MLKEKAIELCLEQDTFAAIEFLATQQDQLDVIKTYGDVMHHFYWKSKDLTHSVAMGRAGLQYGLTSAAQYKESDPERSAELKSAAKALAYDIASFTWDGWAEPGIEITPSDLKTGLDAAETNLRLAIELQKPDLPMSRAYWMLGAQQLSAHQFDNARTSFQAASNLATTAKVPAEALLADAFKVLVCVVESKNPTCETDLNLLISKLENTKDGPDFIPQIRRAKRYYQSLELSNVLRGSYLDFSQKRQNR